MRDKRTPKDVCGEATFQHDRARDRFVPRMSLFTENRSLIFKTVVRADLKRIFLRSVAKTFRASEGSQGCLLLHRTPPLIELVILLLLYNAKIP